ncbi:MAG: hypothetical protein RIA08_02900 [Roseovarius sp.]
MVLEIFLAAAVIGTITGNSALRQIKQYRSWSERLQAMNASA